MVDLQSHVEAKLLTHAHDASAFKVAYSGGLDSTVLLALAHQHCLQHDILLSAIHINHGISSNANAWAMHCYEECQKIGIQLDVVNVSINQYLPHGTEAAARMARYRAFAEHCDAHEVLLMAHHLDDQAETFLLQLIRGAGPTGLRAMPAARNLPIHDNLHIPLLRPLLDIPQNQLLEYAVNRKLRWIEDESNASEQYDRNFLRQQIMPILTHRWPSIQRKISDSARHCAQETEVISDYMYMLETQMLTPNMQIALEQLGTLKQATQACFIRHWLKRQNVEMPSEAILHQILGMAASGQDRQPEVQIGGHCVYRFDRKLCIRSAKYSTVSYRVDFATVDGRLETSNFVIFTCADIDAQLFVEPQMQITVEQGVGVLTHPFKPYHNRPTKPLKQWLKEWKIAPHHRVSVVQIFGNQQLIAVYHDRLIVDCRFTHKQPTRTQGLHFVARHQ